MKVNEIDIPVFQPLLSSKFLGFAAFAYLISTMITSIGPLPDRVSTGRGKARRSIADCLWV